MIRRTAIFIIALLAVMAVPGLIKYKQIQEGMAAFGGDTMPPSTVEAVPVRQVQWPVRVAAVGTLTARDGIDVSNEVEGIIEAIHVESGQQVKAGDLLVTLNSDVEQADLASLEAREDLARTSHDRVSSMWEKKTVSETEYDNARSDLLVAQANLVQMRARIAKKTIRAPFDGVLGIRNVSPGQYIAPGTKLFSLQDHSILFVDFSVPEKHFPDIAPGLEVNIKVSASPDTVFTGTVQAMDAKVDEATRNINIRAQLPNDQGLLLPGMFADIYLVLDQPMARLVVPSTAVVFSSFGDSVFVVEPDAQGGLVARRVQVTTGEHRGDLVEVVAGLTGDEQVVQAGTSKLRNNTPVAVSQQPRLKG